jgi:predicted nucleic acid-binding protein
MPTGGRRPDVLVDTSVAVALVLAGHEGHHATVEALLGRRLGLAGHAAFETFSVLTRLPPPNRRSPTAVARMLAVAFPASRFPSAERTATLSAQLPDLGIAGGSVYDALVGAVAAEHRVPLATRDRRALDTYRALDVQFELLE